MAQAVEHLPCNCKVLSSISVTIIKRKKEGKKKKGRERKEGRREKRKEGILIGSRSETFECQWR
jgi:hypothetical protein